MFCIVSRPRRNALQLSAVTFDIWNTLYSADHGVVDTVRPRRLAVLSALLDSAGARPSEDELSRAYRSGFDAYMAAWDRGVHFGARDQVLHILDFFHRDASADKVDLAAREIEDLSLLAFPQLLPGVRETIPELSAAGFRLGIISDTSLTPGRLLTRFLAADGLLDYFSALTFSDVTGYTKPNPRMFRDTLTHLGATPERAAHVGDTPRTDIAGAKTLGMLAIRCAGAVDHEEPPTADFVIRDHRELPALLQRQRRERQAR
ncbi:MAG: HAD family hydrolase [Actinobacteria bacterium]|nr:HAD family hydrolase [Actinomycetota bacterium]